VNSAPVAVCSPSSDNSAAGICNYHRLWPVAAVGFKHLLERGQAQERALAENKQRVQQLRDIAHKLAQRQVIEVAARVAAARQKHVELSDRLLAVARHADGLEGRLANFQGMRCVTCRPTVQMNALRVSTADQAPCPWNLLCPSCLKHC
jgi:hypothetical protein